MILVKNVIGLPPVVVQTVLLALTIRVRVPDLSMVFKVSERSMDR